MMFTLRGHQNELTALSFPPYDKDSLTNPLLASGDSAGWLYLWDLVYRRPIRAWQAHPPIHSTSGGILHLQSFTTHLTTHLTDDCHELSICIASQGRDNTVHIWSLNDIICSTAGKALDPQLVSFGPSPTPIYSFPTNSLNFCRFAMAYKQMDAFNHVLFAIPNLTDSNRIDIFDYTTRSYMIRSIGLESNTHVKTGIVMCMQFFNQPESSTISTETRSDCLFLLAAGYESGHIIIWNVINGTRLGIMQFHIEPVMSLDIVGRHQLSNLTIPVAPSKAGTWGVSVAADNQLVLFSTEFDHNGSVLEYHRTELPSTGTSDVRIVFDGSEIITAGWDGALRRFKPSKKLKCTNVVQAFKESIKCMECCPCFITELLVQNSLTSNSTQSKLLLQPKQDTLSNKLDRHMIAIGSKDGRICLS
ncbi:Astra associated protein 1 Asa1 [Batrachochytrium dendrobatidis]|nr:Astra associated protein 1 Asa1 [Batrachochytrium dendrobatidis]KAK5670270.1 Astra associated protein 1 Asa1 [Batrachochytrium dendrobatidis]